MSSFTELKKNYKNIPDKDWIETQFGISIPDKNISEINYEIAARIEDIVEILEDLLTVKESYRSFIEHKFLEKIDKEKIYRCFKEFNSHMWKFYYVYINGNTKMHVEWLVETKKLIDNNKEVLEEVFLKISRKWNETKFE